MREIRRVVRRNKGLLLPVPASVRDHLKLYAKLRVYWHTSTQGMALVTTSGRPKGGRKRLDTNCENCIAYQQAITRLEARLKAAPQRAWNLYRTQEIGRQLHFEVKGYPAIDAINDRLREIERAVVELSAVRAPRRRRVGGVLLPPGVTAIDLGPGDGGEGSPPPSPPPSSDGEAPELTEDDLHAIDHARQASGETDPPYADDFDGQGRLIPRT